jgi:serine/threonine-protein kinase
MVLDSGQLNAALPESDAEMDALKGLPAQYELLGKVSTGGMGSIWKVRNRYTGAYAAIKVLHSDAARSREAMSRFVIEAKAASTIKHPNICRVLDFGVTEQGTSYLVMDWIDGIDLERKLNRDRRLTAMEAIPIFIQVAAGLAFAHQLKLVHRDVKPQNIMLTRENDGRTDVQIVDFGIAKVMGNEENTVQGQGLTREGMVVGTPLFMSPEQATAARVDNRSDIYSFGCVMYYALTGRPPFLGGSAIETVTKHLTELPAEFSPSLKVPPGLKTIVFRTLEKKPEDRYASMDELLTDLKKLTKGVKLESRQHAGQRQAKKKTFIIVLCFILSFVITYAVKLGLEHLLGEDDTNHASKQTQAQGDKQAPEQSKQSQQPTK